MPIMREDEVDIWLIPRGFNYYACLFSFINTGLASS